MFTLNDGRQICQLEKGEEFSFKGDKKVYVFGGCDGNYATVFSSLKDYKEFKNPSYVENSTRIAG